MLTVALYLRQKLASQEVATQRKWERIKAGSGRRTRHGTVILEQIPEAEISYRVSTSTLTKMFRLPNDGQLPGDRRALSLR